MPLARIPLLVRRVLVVLAAAAIVVAVIVESDRLGSYSEYCRRKASEYAQVESQLLETQHHYTELEKAECIAAARFRRGEWGGDDDKHKAKFDQLIGSLNGSVSESKIQSLRKSHFDSMAKTREDLANQFHELAASFGTKAARFARLRQKYEQGARTPWRSVPVDPGDPR